MGCAHNHVDYGVDNLVEIIILGLFDLIFVFATLLYLSIALYIIFPGTPREKVIYITKNLIISLVLVYFVIGCFCGDWYVVEIPTIPGLTTIIENIKGCPLW